MSLSEKKVTELLEEDTKEQEQPQNKQEMLKDAPKEEVKVEDKAGWVMPEEEVKKQAAPAPQDEVVKQQPPQPIISQEQILHLIREEVRAANA